MHDIEANFERGIFPWNPHFEVGVHEIDEQHRTLVGFINDICFAALNDEDHHQEVDSLFHELVDYANFHFDYEEQFFAKQGISESAILKHKNQHDGLTEHLKNLRRKYDQDADKHRSLDDILTFLVLWLSNHILYDDLYMCLMVEHMGEHEDFKALETVVQQQMSDSRANVSKVMVAMTNISNASFKELRKEVAYRRKIESVLKEEIATRIEAEEELKYLAQHDALTRLPNRLLFEELSGLALKAARRNQAESAILFIDIDGFKEVNDKLGHDAGDSLLVSIADRLKSAIRESDVLARMGGDEFVIHLGSGCTSSGAEKTAAKIVAEMSQPFWVGEKQVRVSASVGVSMFPDDAADTESLIKLADKAMYAAKKSGKNAYTRHSEI